MILYREDFYNQRAVYHFNTKNLSAIRFAKLLKEMGIENNKFILALTQPELANINPFSKDLSLELKQKIAYEIKINIWYYLREIITVPAQGSIDGVPYEFNRANVALTWLIYNSIDTFELIPRQIGKTIGTHCPISHLIYFGGTKYGVGAFAKDQSLVQQNVSRLKEIRDNLPSYLIDKSAKDIDNKEGLDYKALNNSYKTFVAQKDARAAERQARGESFSLTYHDEFCWYANIHLSYPAATGSMGAAREQAQKMGLPSCSIKTSTAGRLDDPSGRYAHSYKSNSFRFTEKLYDCKNKTELIDILKFNSMNGAVYCEFSWKQLGKTQEWYDKNTRGKDKDTIAMDYDNKWLSGKEGKALPTEILESLIEIEPVSYSQFNNFVVRWYVTEEVRNSAEFRNRSFVAGIDTSTNVGIDYTSFTMVDISTLDTICTCRTNTSNLTLFAFFVVEMMNNFNKLVLIPERNGNGVSLIDNIVTLLLSKKINPFRVIFNYFLQDYDSKKEKRSIDDLESNGIDRRFLGFKTTGPSRYMLYSSVLVSSVSYCKDKIHDSIIIDEIKGLVDRNGRIDHEEGCHDDQLIAWLLCMYFIFHGKNMGYYNLDVHTVLSSVDLVGNSIDPLEKKRQIELRERIEEIEKRIPFVSHYMKDVLEKELKELRIRVNKDIELNTGTISRLQIEKGDNIVPSDDSTLLTSVNNFRSLMDSFFNR